MRIAFLGAAAAAALGLAASAQTAPPQPATGSITFTSFAQTAAREADGNLVTEGAITALFTGTISGTVHETYHWVIRADGTGEFHAVGTITGRVGTCGTGTVPFHVNAVGTLANFTGQGNTIDQAAGDTGAHFTIRFSGGAPTFTYSGTYSCR